MPVVLRTLDKRGLLHKDAPTANGKSVWENVKQGSHRVRPPRRSGRAALEPLRLKRSTKATNRAQQEILAAPYLSSGHQRARRRLRDQHSGQEASQRPSESGAEALSSFPKAQDCRFYGDQRL
nr:hypothetical protein [Microvirga pakistanensis]